MAKKKSAATDIPTSSTASAARKRTSGAAARANASNGDTRRHPTHDEIAEAAYHRYLSRQGGGGSDFDDWLEAERELQSRSAAKNQ
jgi:hypothetical protein